MTARSEVLFEPSQRDAAHRVIVNGGVLVLRADPEDAPSAFLGLLVDLAPGYSRVVVDPGPRGGPLDLLTALRSLLLAAHDRSGVGGPPVVQIMTDKLEGLLTRLAQVSGHIPGGPLLVLRDVGQPKRSEQLRLNEQGALLGCPLVVTCRAETRWERVHNPTIVDLRPISLSAALLRIAGHPRWAVLPASERMAVTAGLKADSFNDRLRLSMLYDVVVQLLDAP